MSVMHGISRAALLVLALTLPGVAWADCFSNGEQVPEGARIGNLVCKDGKWQPG